MSRRPVGRLLASLALLGLGLVAATRVPVGERAERAAHSFRVTLSLPSPSEPDDVARRWLVPVESAVRGLGGVTSLSGTVTADAAWLDVELEAGVDASRKVARLTSSLATLRERMPAGSRLDARASGAGSRDRVAVLALTGPDAERRALEIAERFEALPGVREVQSFGAPMEQVRVHLRAGAAGDPAALESAVHQAIAARLSRSWLGESAEGSRRLAVLTRSTVRPALEDVPVRIGRRVLALSTLADIEVGRREPRSAFRFQGRGGLALVTWRRSEAPLLAVDAAVQRLGEQVSSESSGRLRVEPLVREAESLRRLLRHAARGLVVALVAAVVAGAALAGWRGALGLGFSWLVAVASALNALLLCGVALNAHTVPAALLGLAVALPLPVSRLAGASLLRPWRVVTTLACLLAIPACVSLASASLAPLLAAPAKGFSAAGVGALLAGALVPLPAGRRPRRHRAGRLLRRVLRDPAFVVLAGATLAHVLLSAFGGALDPRASGDASQRGRYAVSLTLPSGTTLGETQEVVAASERELQRIPGVARHWSELRPGGATLHVEVAASHLGPRELGRVETLLRYRMGAGAASAHVSEERAAGGPALVLSGARGRRPATDEGAVSYRYVLRGESLPALDRARQAARRAIARAGDSRQLSVSSEWGESALVLELAPSSRSAAAQLRGHAAWLRERAGSPPSLDLPGRPRRELVIVAPGRSVDESEPLTRLELMEVPVTAGGEPVALGALHELREARQAAAVPREDGRFVEAVTVGFGFRADSMREQARKRVDRLLSNLELPPGVLLERPRLDPDAWTPERLRLLGLAALLPAVLFGLAIVRLDSPSMAAMAVAPVLLALAAAAPVVALARLGLDALGVLALAAVAVGLLPPVLQLLADARDGARHSSAGAAAYRSLRRHAPTLATAGVLAAGLLLGTTLSVDAAADPWALPLVAAAAASLAGAAAALTVAPALVEARLHVGQRDAEAERRLRVPPEWRREAGPPRLTVRSLTKVYRSGFEALSNVSFELGPGVVGLLGPNGAGKTTLMRVLIGLLNPTRGEVRYRDVPLLPLNLAVYRESVGFLPQEFNAFPGLTGEEFLEYWGRERGLNDRRQRRERVERLLHSVGLAADGSRRVRDYSGGMRQRIGIALALVTEPPILIVDEPTTGLDVESRNAFREVLLRIAGERIVILSTHLASDVEATATRLLLLERGRLRFDGRPSELIAQARGRVFETLVSDGEHAAFSQRHRVTSRLRTADGVRLRVVGAPGEEPAGRLVEPSLEEAYLAAVGVGGGRAAAGPAVSRFAFLSDWRREDGLEEGPRG